MGGVSKSTLRKIQALQDQAVRIAIGKAHPRLTDRQKHRLLGWLPVNQEVKYATFKMAYRVLNTQIPEEMASQMPQNITGTG